MSQARLAEAIGLRKAQSISDAETGSYAPSADTLIALANLACRTDVAFSQWCLLAAGVEPELLRLVRGLRQEVKITLHVDDSGLVTDAELGR
jgi:transcriptional regulator with XRE-family HTH domain